MSDGDGAPRPCPLCGEALVDTGRQRVCPRCGHAVEKPRAAAAYRRRRRRAILVGALVAVRDYAGRIDVACRQGALGLEATLDFEHCNGDPDRGVRSLD